MNKRRVGTFYEEAVCEYLKNYNIKILANNFRCKSGEIDIIGQDGECTVFFEVKYRKNGAFGNPLDAITEQKQKTICKCAAYYCMQHKEITQVRYDVIGILGSEITWIKDAFEHRGYSFLSPLE